MGEKHEIKLFESRQVRAIWDDEKEEWYFSIVDVCGVLTDSENPQTYWRVLKKRLIAEGNQTVTNCNALKMRAADGKMRKTDVATAEQLFRIIQSIPSKKAEPFKQWMAQVAAQRLEQIQDPELNFEQAFADYRRLGYSEKWINQRLQTIKARKELTDEWHRAGVQEGLQYATLTDIITREWSGRTTREYKRLKGLKKESLRDNMTTMELALNMLAEATTAEISRSKNPSGFKESAQVAHEGGKIAGETRAKIEAQTGRSIVTSDKASDYLPPTDRLGELPDEDDAN